MNKNKFIILTDAANSGKSTLTKNIAETLSRDGFNVRFLRISARDILAGPKSLKDLREKPRVYLRLQEKIFKAQLDQIFKASKTNCTEPVIFIFDRFILDTYMYTDIYCRPSGLFRASLTKKKEALKRQIFDNAIFLADTLRPLFIRCAPIPVNQPGIFRPENMQQSLKDYAIVELLKILADCYEDKGQNMISIDSTNPKSLEVVKERIYLYLNN